MVATMRPSRALPIVVGMAALWPGGCAAAEFGDDFANNLLTDLAPYVFNLYEAHFYSN